MVVHTILRNSLKDKKHVHSTFILLESIVFISTDYLMNQVKEYFYYFWISAHKFSLSASNTVHMIVKKSDNFEYCSEFPGYTTIMPAPQIQFCSIIVPLSIMQPTKNFIAQWTMHMPTTHSTQITAAHRTFFPFKCGAQSFFSYVGKEQCIYLTTTLHIVRI